MDIRMGRRFSVAIALCVFANALHAYPITGSFSGLASGNRGCYGGCTFFENEPLTGTFSFETESSVPIERYDGYNDAYAMNWPMTLSFTVLGETASFSSPNDSYSNVLSMSGDQSLSINFYAARGDASYILLGSFDGGLLNDFNPATFDATAVDLEGSSAHFSRDARSENTWIQLQRISFDNGVVVSEPSPLPLLVLGVLLIGMPGFRRAVRRAA